MSASLVGSEMCIRDSSSAVQCCPSFSFRSGGHRPPTNHKQRTIAPRYTCLLYTSDAADDM
eukprot:7214895-Alexandrium_andersonii.AAC.1